MLQSVGLYLPSENTFIDYTDINPILMKMSTIRLLKILPILMMNLLLITLMTGFQMKFLRIFKRQIQYMKMRFQQMITPIHQKNS